MNLRERFEHLADQWRTHCRQVAFSSNLQDRLTHAAFRRLIDLGRDAVPLMMEQLVADDDAPWEFVLQEVTHTRFIEDAGDFDPDEVLQRRLHWWARHRQEFQRPDQEKALL